jgi:exonuclease III
MKIVTWNCNGAFRKKCHLFDNTNFGIIVIQECEDPRQSTKAYLKWSGDYLWKGENKNKGLGIFSRGDVRISQIDWPDGETREFISCRVNDSFNLVAVWAKGAAGSPVGYAGQVYKYIEVNWERLKNDRVVVCGDFNSNSIWDDRHEVYNHSNIVAKLDSFGLSSMYHSFNGADHGSEQKPTLYMYRNIDKPYHIDYAFCSADIISQFPPEIGGPAYWLNFSDHMPLIFEVNC